MGIRNSLSGNGAKVISLKKLDGSKMFLNEDLIERVEDAVDGQSAVYLINGGHIVVANQASIVVEKIRTEKANLLRRVRQASQDPLPPVPPRPTMPEMTLLTQVRDK